MSAEREAFKALAEENQRHSEVVIKLVTSAILEFFKDHPCVESLLTVPPMTVQFDNRVPVDAEELAKLSKCMKALEINLAPVRAIINLPHVVWPKSLSKNA